MALARFSALDKMQERKPLEVEREGNNTSDYYGQLVFSNGKMKKFLSGDAYKAVNKAIEEGSTIDRKMADEVAQGMKAWAMQHGVTHYTHWFHPLTGGTAEKHDAFIDHSGNCNVVEAFEGSLLSQQEPDASSFPNGGLRDTFEARGYTAWDVSSPAFIVNKTLCIPTIFIAFTGESLDYKAPLLKASNLINKAAVDVCQYFDKNVNKVITNLGWEQEYFLVDEGLYNARPDLILTGRTLMGHSSAKDQQLDDHYFSAIPERVKSFMMDLENEAYKLGIPCKTRHNEVAPNQFELAPIYEEVNLANDHNQLMMDLMDRVARKHNFRCLLHEKPFAGINGSGKHNNWSLTTNTGVILYKPGKNPKSNLQFLTFVINTLKAVKDHQDLLRATIVSAGNSHRLGANEAPPAIVSVFLGTEVSKMLEIMEESVTDKKMTPDEKTKLKLNIGRLPEILLDNTDRNRTSPFAFTGNRFEFRAVGSTTNCASPMIALNVALANQLVQFKKDVDALIENGIKKDEAIFQVLKKIIVEVKPIIFNGNGYSDDWVVEAEKRGLTNIKDVPEALDRFLSESSKELFIENKIFTEAELVGRTEVEHEKYTKKIQIEARVLGDLAINHIVPVAIEYQTSLIQNVKGLKDIFAGSEYEELAAVQKAAIKDISLHINSIVAKTDAMVNARKAANKIECEMEKSKAYSKTVAPYLDDVRYHIDHLELMIDNKLWPLPKYRELLFNR